MSKELWMEELRGIWKKRTQYDTAITLLHWDMDVYMPEKGLQATTEALSLLEMQNFETLVSERNGELIQQLKVAAVYESLTPEEQTMLNLFEHEYKKTKIIPPQLYDRFVRVVAQAQKNWQKARQASDFKLFREDLSEILTLLREFAQIYKANFPCEEPLDAFIEDHESGMTAKDIRAVFSRFLNPLVELVEKIREKGNPTPNPLLFKVKEKTQVNLCHTVLKKMGYDLAGGRVDFSSHPFSIRIGAGDVRLTIRAKESDFTESFYSAMHEGGHALYEQNLPEPFLYTPIYNPSSSGIHESQSRLWENIVGRSFEFWESFYPALKKEFKSYDIPALPEFYKAINRVEPSFIRTEADEVTYNLHIILRFELEDALLKGDLAVDDLPLAWNDKTKRYLGINPTKASDGVLQDIHWSMGAFGYFPSYTLGNLYSVQFFNQAIKQIPDLKEQIRKGNYATLLKWLRENIHQKGNLYAPLLLCEKVTGETLNPDYYMTYLQEKYTKIYDL